MHPTLAGSVPRALPIVGLLWCLLLGPRIAAAEIHFTKPVPTFAQALAAARQAGKPLVVEMSASWCAPCQQLAQDLAQPQNQRATAPLHLVVYDASSDETGASLKDTLKVEALPTLISFNDRGEEVERIEGYAQWSTLEAWLQRVPISVIPIEQAKRLVEASPQNGQLQLDLARRLDAAQNPREALQYYLRAQQTGPTRVSAAAAWQLAERHYREQLLTVGQEQMLQIAQKYPGTREATGALVFLATTAAPSARQLEPLLSAHAEKLTRRSDLNYLAYLAMKSGAMKVAVKIAARLASEKDLQAGELDTLAEVAFYAEEDTSKALALSEQAVAAASAADRAQLLRNQARFRRDRHEPSETLGEIDRAELGLGPAEQPSRRAAPPLPAEIKVWPQVDRLLSTACWQQDPTVPGPFRITLLTGSTPESHWISFSPATPAGWAACARRAIRSAALPAGILVDLSNYGMSRAFAQQFEDAKRAAERDCAPLAGTREQPLVLTAERGQVATIVYPSTDAMTPALRSCLQKALAGLKPTRPIVQGFRLTFQ